MRSIFLVVLIILLYGYVLCIQRMNDRTDVWSLFVVVATRLTKDAERTSWTAWTALISVFGKTAVWRFFGTR